MNNENNSFADELDYARRSKDIEKAQEKVKELRSLGLPENDISDYMSLWMTIINGVELTEEKKKRFTELDKVLKKKGEENKSELEKLVDLGMSEEDAKKYRELILKTVTVGRLESPKEVQELEHLTNLKNSLSKKS